MHKNELICQKCAINCGIGGNASNENSTKYKNLSGVKSISNFVQWLARYRIVALISIGRLCNSVKVESRNYCDGTFPSWLEIILSRVPLTLTGTSAVWTSWTLLNSRRTSSTSTWNDRRSTTRSRWWMPNSGSCAQSTTVGKRKPWGMRRDYWTKSKKQAF